MDAAQRDWGASGLAHLTGLPSSAPDFSRAGVLAAARTVAGQLHRRLGIAVDAGELLTGRAALLGLSRRGRVSAGGATRLMPAADGWWALTLSRPDDVDAVPALLEVAEPQIDPWPPIAAWAAERDAADVVERAVLLGLPVARLDEAYAAPPTVRRTGGSAGARGFRDLLVVDLSSMWAGPLCGRLLREAGATVVKVESAARPDGTRAGPPAFFDWMNGGKLSYAVDFVVADPLRTLLEAADVVIESSRPLALRHRGLAAEDVAARDGRVWLRITGHGADGVGAHRTAFGDDAAVAGGLVGRSSEGPVFCGDAIADPLTGLHAALAVAESLSRGGGEVIDVSMSAVAATHAALPATVGDGNWHAPPPEPPVRGEPAAALGADNGRVERLVAGRAGNG